MALDPQNTAQIRDRELRVWDLLLKALKASRSPGTKAWIPQ